MLGRNELVDLDGLRCLLAECRQLLGREHHVLVLANSCLDHVGALDDDVLLDAHIAGAAASRTRDAAG